MPRFKKPELLAPAGDESRLRAAVLYGADAVYLGSSAFGMRASAANFSGEKLKNACDYARSKGVKVYLACNTVPRNSELKKLPDFLKYAEQSGVDAFIITDIGVMELAKKVTPDVAIHISTQAGIANYAAARAFYEAGAGRIITAREISLEEIAEIRAKTPKELEIECFVHGAMCVSFSGRCVLSNYTAGRDANRGDCAQPCRWKYYLMEEKRPGEYFPIYEDENGTYIMNSKDMNLIEHIPSLIRAGIDSFKIEGRAKSDYYTAATVNAYRRAIDDCEKTGFSEDYRPEPWITDELNKTSNRGYCSGFYFSSPLDDPQISYKGGYARDWDEVAVVEKWENGILYAVQKNKFFEGDELEALTKGKKPFKVVVKNLKNEAGEPIESAPRPTMKFSFDCPAEISAGAYLRIKNS